MNQPQKLILAGGATGLVLMILRPPCFGIDRGSDGRRHAFMYYQRTGRAPRRPGGHDWPKPVDGTTFRTEWSGLHPASDLLQVTNPPQGYMQNCNVRPDVMMEDSPFRPERTIPWRRRMGKSSGPAAATAPGPARAGWAKSRA